MSDARFSRRDLARGALALAILPACGPVTASIDPADDGGSKDPVDGGADPVCSTEHGSAAEGWIAIPLAEHPEVAAVGGASVVHDSTSLLQAVVIQPTPGCFKAVWEICPHGSCEVEWQPEHAWLECPCHGSRFGDDGSLIQGPATTALKSFPVVRDGDTLWLKRR